MAWIFSLWIEAEKDSERKAIKEYFDGRTIFVNNKSYNVHAYETGMITVDGISRIGITSQSDADEMTSIGFELYKLLKQAPDFRYGMTGVEVDGIAFIDELTDDPEFFLRLDGFVINQKVYEKIKGKQVMMPFKDGYLWMPYKGESFEQNNA